MTDELSLMGWSCHICGQPFPHGRVLVDHLLRAHPVWPDDPPEWSAP